MIETKKSIYSVILKSFWTKVFGVSCISILLIIPLVLVKFQLHQRQSYKNIASADITKKWGKTNGISTITVDIPAYKIETTTKYNKKTSTKKYFNLSISPTFTKQDIEMDVFYKNRGIYQIPIYKSKIKSEITFDKIELEKIFSKQNFDKIKYKESKLNIKFSSLKHLKAFKFKLNETNLLDSSIEIEGNTLIIKNLDFNRSINLTANVELTGSDTFSVIPFAKKHVTTLKSNWPHPSFSGDYLPDEHNVTETGFTANWKTTHLNTGIPSSLITVLGATPYSEYQHTGHRVKIYDPVTVYTLNDRVIKYSFLLVILTFITLIFIEIVLRTYFHLAHYLLAGISLVLFYLLLLAFSEHLGFTMAYLVSSTMSAGSLGLYILGVSKKAKDAFIVFAQICSVNFIFHQLIHSPESALLWGSIMLWIVLVVAMYTTRKLNWSKLS